MDTYYEILGIDQDADQNTVKRAYFKEIRKHTPEQEPERFKQIREAYEVLSDEKKRQQYDGQFEVEPAFRMAYGQVQKWMMQGDYQNAINCCNEVLRISEEEPFLRLLAKCYEYNENTGKEVKTYERLTEKYPKNQEYHIDLAKAYQRRGWWKKACAIMDNLDRQGCKSIYFYKTYGQIFVENNFFDEAVSVYQNGIQYVEEGSREKECFRDYSMLQAEYIACMLELSKQKSVKNLFSALEKYYGFLNNHSEHLEELQEDLLTMLVVLQPEDLQHRYWIKRFYELFMKSGGVESVDGDVGRIVSVCMNRVELAEIQDDDVISDKVKEYLEELYYEYSLISEIEQVLKRQETPDEVSREVYKSKQYEEYEIERIDLMLTILDSWDDAKAQMQRVKDTYPVLSEILGEFVDEVLNASKQSSLWAKYERIYKKLNHMPSNGRLVRADMEKVVFNSAEDGTYRREEKKIGRNEPCPCGSGKKYKNCCGKN